MEEQFARCIVCVQTAECPEQAVGTWWITYAETESISSRGRALSLKAEEEPTESFHNVDFYDGPDSWRPYSSVLHDLGESIVADTDIPECLFATRWGRLTAFKCRDKSQILLTVTKHAGASDSRDERWAMNACLEMTLHVTRWMGKESWPSILVCGFGDACGVVCELAGHLQRVSACTALSVWLVAPVGERWPVPKLKHVGMNALYHGGDGRCVRVPGANEFWLQGKRECGDSSFGCCCGSRKPVEDNVHKLSVYARDVWKCIEQN
jgi:hypothetical protein